MDGLQVTFDTVKFDYQEIKDCAIITKKYPHNKIIFNRCKFTRVDFITTKKQSISFENCMLSDCRIKNSHIADLFVKDAVIWNFEIENSHIDSLYLLNNDIIKIWVINTFFKEYTIRKNDISEVIINSVQFGKMEYLNNVLDVKDLFDKNEFRNNITLNSLYNISISRSLFNNCKFELLGTHYDHARGIGHFNVNETIFLNSQINSLKLPISLINRTNVLVNCVTDLYPKKNELVILGESYNMYKNPTPVYETLTLKKAVESVHGYARHTFKVYDNSNPDKQRHIYTFVCNDGIYTNDGNKISAEEYNKILENNGNK